jgi:methyltransferase (TIGR00027 family)
MSVRDISDTARWVAWYRAVESDRPDALFRDPYARRLAGTRGADIARTMPGAKNLGWVMVTRTCLFDELVMRAVTSGAVDTVLNLAAGFDARPYRLPLPATIRWVEVDLPPLLEEKQSILAGERAACELETVPLDLADVAGRAALFARVGGRSRGVLVLTEGLLAYLAPEDVLALARALHVQPAIRQWATDLASPYIMKQVMQRANDQLRQAGSAFRFAPEEGEEFFRPVGWVATEFHSMVEEAQRLGREMPLAGFFRLLSRLIPPGRRAEMARRYRSGVVLLERT